MRRPDTAKGVNWLRCSIVVTNSLTSVLGVRTTKAYSVPKYTVGAQRGSVVVSYRYCSDYGAGDDERETGHCVERYHEKTHCHHVSRENGKVSDNVEIHEKVTILFDIHGQAADSNLQLPQLEDSISTTTVGAA